MERYYNERSLKQQLIEAKKVKENTGMLSSIARLKLKKLSDMESHNEYSSEINAEHGYLGYSIVPYYNTSKLYQELYPPKKMETTSIRDCGCDSICDCLPF